MKLLISDWFVMLTTIFLVIIRVKINISWNHRSVSPTKVSNLLLISLHQILRKFAGNKNSEN